MTLPKESSDVNCKSQEIWSFLVHPFWNDSQISHACGTTPSINRVNPSFYQSLGSTGPNMSQVWTKAQLDKTFGQPSWVIPEVSLKIWSTRSVIGGYCLFGWQTSRGRKRWIFLDKIGEFSWTFCPREFVFLGEFSWTFFGWILVDIFGEFLWTLFLLVMKRVIKQ